MGQKLISFKTKSIKCMGQWQFNGERIVFSANGARTSGYLYRKNEPRPSFYIKYKN